ncbi:MAG: xanthine dehydrogenase family protein subunit M [Thermoanaerobaculia bacterium]|nr:xanthine dehydrogenase family protein subunit M [Thermoanaerobaculia bacterium]
MKPPPFDYVAPETVDEALEILGERGYDAKILAGGQSLIPLLNFRLAAPAVLVDVNRLSELAYIGETEKSLRIGALTRVSQLERDPRVARLDPLLAAAVPHVAHPQIRNRGTVGGSLAHADPAAELPVLAVARRARLRIRSRDGERWADAGDFYQGLMTTDLAPEEMVVEMELPPLPGGSGWAFVEFARRHGDYALMGVAAILTPDGAGGCAEARLTYLSAGEVPVVAERAGALLADGSLSDEKLDEAAALAAAEEVRPSPDIHASEAYKRHLAKVLTRRALRQARERMSGGATG